MKYRLEAATFALTAAIVAGVSPWVYPRSASASKATVQPDIVGIPVGTSGTAAANEGTPASITEFDTIAGTLDGHQLVGHKVDLHVVAQEGASARAFWIGGADNRVLVVLGPDSHHQRSPVRRGQPTTIAGSVQRLPKASEMRSWGLTPAEAAELADRRIYIRADSVTTTGHGTH